MGHIRPPAVAGMFYPGSAAELDTTVRRFLSAVPPVTGRVPKAVIAPHAGYVYSGAVAATAYKRLEPARKVIRRVVLLGPCHRVAVRGLAVSGADAFSTPLGDVPLDKDAIAAILALPQVAVVDATHAQEHSLEVHLPFLQEVLDRFSLVPLVVGDASPDQVTQVIEALWGGPETLIVVSTDLSHYLDYASAQRIDGRTRAAIEALEPAAIGRDQACGRIPMGGLLTVARRRRMTIETVDCRNSGDTAGDKRRVVGYGSWLLFDAEPAATGDNGAGGRGGGLDEHGFEAATKALLARHGPLLLRLAAQSIMHGLDTGKPPTVNVDSFPADLREPGACFVTLKRDDRLRGCIGSPQAHRPLVEDVVANGFGAAFRDSRFGPLTRSELDGLDLSMSVLSPSVPMRFRDQGDLLGQLRAGIDGLIIGDGARRALFLPVVWEQLPQKEEFLAHLKAKAGLRRDHWSPTFEARRFIAEEIYARDLPDPPSVWAA